MPPSRPIIIAAIICALPSAAAAAPVYLSCEVRKGEGKPYTIELVANEEQQLLTVAIPATGYAGRFPAVFMQDSVTAKDSRIYTDTVYSLSRIHLRLVRTLTAGTVTYTEEGQCAVRQAPQRAF